MTKLGSGTGNGVAMHEFDSEDACHSAGRAWEEEVAAEAKGYNRNQSFFLCVPKR